MTTTVRPFDRDDFLKVESVFARTYGFVARQSGLYLLLILVLGVAPNLLIARLAGLPLGDLSHAAMSVRLLSMGLFIVCDAVMCAILAKATLDHLTGRPVSLGGALDIPVARWAGLFWIAVALDAPMLGLNLLSSLIGGGTAVQLALYGLRFAAGITLGAVWCGATAIVLAEGAGPLQALRRAAALTAGHRWRTALFFAAFFLLKVLGPYLLLQWGLGLLGPGSPAFALLSTVVWNYLACALGVATTFIYADLRRLSRR